MTLIVVSHDVAVAERADRVVRLVDSTGRPCFAAGPIRAMSVALRAWPG